MDDRREPGKGGGGGNEPRFPRRSFLTAAGAAAATLVLPVGLRKGLSLSGARSLAASAGRFRVPLPIPKVLKGDDIVIPMRVAGVPILPGRRTRMWTYAGTFPGPTIRRRAGQLTRVTFVHRLPRKAGELTVHLHGGHTPSRHDGQPGGLTETQSKSFYCDISPDLSPKVSGNDLLISPGERRTYRYPLMEDGAPERAAFQWYHDHRLDRTSRNVWRGLAGMFIIDDEVDEALPLPRGDRDIPLLVCDRSFDSENQLTNPFGLRPPNDGVVGRHVLVNGAYAPFHRVSARRHRLRILNASNFQAYRLHLSNGAPLIQVATESGLMPAPVKRDHILLGPAERVEVIVDFRGAAGRDVQLRSGGASPRSFEVFQGPLMQFRVGSRRSDATRVPDSLRPLPDWAIQARAGWETFPAIDKTWTVGLSGLPPKWRINGRTFDPSYVEHSPQINTTEVWRLVNDTARAHVMHLHATDWYMLERNGREPRPHEDCLKESFLLRPQDEVIVAGGFSDHLGKFVVHCHMLDHEDHGLMSQFEVVP